MDLGEIRKNIDRVDQEIRQLFIERMSLAEQVAQVKSETGNKIFKPDREKEIIVNNSRFVDSSIESEYQALIRKIMGVSRQYQYGRMLELCDCFPFVYEKEKVNFHKVAVLDNCSCTSDFKAERFFTVSSYEEMAELIENHQVDGGIAVMEEVGSGVNAEFHHMLNVHSFYINDCIVTKESHPKKCVLFSDHLVVLPEHNRFKIMFTCPNCAGSCAGILSMIADNQINFTEIHSTPIQLTSGEQSWDYQFYLELEGNMDRPDIRSLIYQLSEETTSFKLLGSYHCEGDFT